MLKKRDAELVRKGILAGIGLGALTAEKAQKVINELIRKGEVNKEEGKKIARQMINESKQYKKILTEDIAKEVKASLTTIFATSKKEMDRLANKVKELEKKKRKK
ncbi:hypothetical protein HY643_00685 [Candidatus Woesearchaeota archaeon]|nr:hypothetical protein [Candidatus Woesearchaeota archaeon]